MLESFFARFLPLLCGMALLGSADLEEVLFVADGCKEHELPLGELLFFDLLCCALGFLVHARFEKCLVQRYWGSENEWGEQ